MRPAEILGLRSMTPARLPPIERSRRRGIVGGRGAAEPAGRHAVLTGIDHLVIVTRDLGQAIAEYRGLGFSVVPGGRHPVGTENALIALRDGAYIELIAFESQIGRASCREREEIAEHDGSGSEKE